MQQLSGSGGRSCAQPSFWRAAGPASREPNITRDSSFRVAVCVRLLDEDGDAGRGDNKRRE